MNHSIENSSVKPTESVKKSEPQRLQSLSGFADELSKYPSLTNGLLKFLCHPFILLGGIIVAIYFFLQARKSGSNEPEIIKLRHTNKELLTEVKDLRIENKKLMDQLGLLPSDKYDYPARGRKLLTTGKKKIGVARLE